MCIWEVQVPWGTRKEQGLEAHYPVLVEGLSGNNANASGFYVKKAAKQTAQSFPAALAVVS